MITPQDYATLAEILRAHSGHHLTEGKEYLVERRLEPVAASLGFSDLEALVRHLRLVGDRRTIKLVCEAMTTNESLFFRDGRPFDLLRTRLLPELLERRSSRRSLRIWSAAASTGQEAYSIAMVLDEMESVLAGWRVEILGTDYSSHAVGRAKEGVYNHFEVQRGLPIQMLVKHFEQQDGNSWKIKDHLKRRIRFQEGNLHDSFGQLGTFDIVFCRNVLIYFDDRGKRDVLERLAGATASDGYLFLGASETALGISQHWNVVTGANTTLFRRTLPGELEARRNTA